MHTFTQNVVTKLKMQPSSAHELQLIDSVPNNAGGFLCVPFHSNSLHELKISTSTGTIVRQPPGLPAQHDTPAISLSERSKTPQESPRRAHPRNRPRSPGTVSLPVIAQLLSNPSSGSSSAISTPSALLGEFAPQPGFRNVRQLGNGQMMCRGFGVRYFAHLTRRLRLALVRRLCSFLLDGRIRGRTEGFVMIGMFLGAVVFMTA